MAKTAALVIHSSPTYDRVPAADSNHSENVPVHPVTTNEGYDSAPVVHAPKGTYWDVTPPTTFALALHAADVAKLLVSRVYVCNNVYI